MSDLVASHKVMRKYLAALLTEEQEPEVKTVVADVKKQQLNQLLSTVTPVTEKTTVQTPPVVKAKVEAKVTPEIVRPAVVTPVQVKAVTPEIALKQAVPPAPPPAQVLPKEYRQGRFQALFFEVAGLKVALPLKDLGGIHQITTINTLPGKPVWYKGVMLYREQKINIVDTAMWVMPEKYDQKLAESLNYQYVIMLGKSSWGIACESLINTVALEQEDVKWRAAQGKRPWLAGLIKQHMCALLDVDALIALLAQGAGSSD